MVGTCTIKEKCGLIIRPLARKRAAVTYDIHLCSDCVVYLYSFTMVQNRGTMQGLNSTGLSRIAIIVSFKNLDSIFVNINHCNVFAHG